MYDYRAKKEACLLSFLYKLICQGLNFPFHYSWQHLIFLADQSHFITHGNIWYFYYSNISDGRLPVHNGAKKFLWQNQNEAITSPNTINDYNNFILKKKKKKKIKDKYQNQTTNNQLESETLTWHEDMQCECWECMRVRGGILGLVSETRFHF